MNRDPKMLRWEVMIALGVAAGFVGDLVWSVGTIPLIEWLHPGCLSAEWTRADSSDLPTVTFCLLPWAAAGAFVGFISRSLKSKTVAAVALAGTILGFAASLPDSEKDFDVLSPMILTFFGSMTGCFFGLLFGVFLSLILMARSDKSRLVSGNPHSRP